MIKKLILCAWLGLIATGAKAQMVAEDALRVTYNICAARYGAAENDKSYWISDEHGTRKVTFGVAMDEEMESILVKDGHVIGLDYMVGEDKSSYGVHHLNIPEMADSLSILEYILTNVDPLIESSVANEESSWGAIKSLYE